MPAKAISEGLRHVFACCQRGAERQLKAQVADVHPTLRPAFARPGLVTWVADAPVSPAFALGSPFARVWGASLGRLDSVAALAPRLGEPLPIVHVFPRDPSAAHAAAEVARGLAAFPAPWRTGELPTEGALVLDVVVAPGEPWLVGLHQHGRGRSGHPGGDPKIALPAEAPSRAYLKLEEAVAWAELDVRAGHVALELGAAPGGAALALARRGVTVWGVDPGAIDPRVLAFTGPRGARVHHLATTVQELRWEQLPRHVDWLLVDVNLAPRVALHAVARLMPPLRSTLTGAIFTFKLNDAHVLADLPTTLARVSELGFSDVRVTQLPANRRELCCVALR